MSKYQVNKSIKEISPKEECENHAYKDIHISANGYGSIEI